jgi:hypothetical protein
MPDSRAQPQGGSVVTCIANVIEALETALSDKEGEISEYERDYAGYIEREGSRWHTAISILKDERKSIVDALEYTKNSHEKLKKAYEDAIWMAIRYAHGRMSYAPGMVRDSIRQFQEVFPDWKPKEDHSLLADRARMEETLPKGMQPLKSDWLDDLVRQETI